MGRNSSHRRIIRPHEDDSSEDEAPQRVLRSSIPPNLKKQVKRQQSIPTIDLTQTSPVTKNKGFLNSTMKKDKAKIRLPDLQREASSPCKVVLDRSDIERAEKRKKNRHHERTHSSSSKKSHKSSKDRDRKPERKIETADNKPLQAAHSKPSPFKPPIPTEQESKMTESKDKPSDMPVLRQKFNIKHADRNPGPKPIVEEEDKPIKLRVSMPEIDKAKDVIEPQVEIMKPIRYELEFAHPKDPQYGEVITVPCGRKKKTQKHFATTSTQTLHANVRDGAPIDLSKYIKKGLNEFFNAIQKGIAPGEGMEKDAYIHLPYNIGEHANKLAINVPLQIKNPGRMQINKKAKVPTGTTKNNQCDAISSTSNGAAQTNGDAPNEPEPPKKPLVPSGAFESQPLWKKQDVWKLGSFKDRYDFPKKKKYVVDRELLDEEDRRMFELNELEKQKATYEGLRRREIDLFGDEISDDDNVSRASTADADFSDDDGNLPKRPKKDEAPDLMALFNDIPGISDVRLENSGPQETFALPELGEDIFEKVEPEKTSKKKKKERHQKEDDEISLVPSSMGSFSPSRMDDFSEIEQATAEVKKKRPVPGMIPIETVKAKVAKTESSKTTTESNPKETSDRNTEETFQYYNNLRDYFCNPFLKNGKCGYPCRDLECIPRLKGIPFDQVKIELRDLSPSELKEIYKFIASSYTMFNKFFPVLSSALGIKGLVVELTSAIAVCEKKNFEISYYKWVVDGLIRANFTKTEAIDTLLKNKKLETPRAMKTVLEIVLQNELLNEFFSVVNLCAATPSFKFDTYLVLKILEFCFMNEIPNCANLLTNIILDLMTEEARTELALDENADFWLNSIMQREAGDEEDDEGIDNEAAVDDNHDEINMDIDTELMAEPEMILGGEPNIEP